MNRGTPCLLLVCATLSLHCSSLDSGQPQLVASAGDTPAELSSARFIDLQPLPTLQPRSGIDLGAFFPPQAELVGVALDARDESAQPYVLEARTGLYQLTGSGAELVFDLRASRVLGGTGDGSPPLELTDVAFDLARSQRVGTASFALTAENDGFALDLPSALLESYFCYFPRPVELGPTPSVSQELRQQGIPVVERTEAVALNPSTRQIVAQPRTLRLDNGDIAGSELFVFDDSGGSPVGTRRLERAEFAAGGAAFQRGSLTLGFGSDIYDAGGWGSDLLHWLHLEGVEKITGLAARANGDLLVLDGPNRRLLNVGMQEMFDALHN